MKHPETHKRMTHLGQRRMRHAIANANGSRRPSARWLRRVFLLAAPDYVSASEGLRRWCNAKAHAAASNAKLRREAFDRQRYAIVSI